jgi:serine/threonine protein kinase
MLKSCVGSPIYMAPQLLERTPYTTKCDIWSIGIIYYEMIFGSPPWKARDENELIKNVKNNPSASVIKKEFMSTRASDFLKKTLAYS